mgnify:CR=1 FL=1
MTFEKGNSYKLDFDRVEQVNGKLFFALKHEGKTTLPGCEPFYFRVEALDYQKNWDPDDIPEQFLCFLST